MNSKTTCFIIFLSAFVLLANFSFAQNKQLLPDNIQVDFLKDSFEVESNSFEFNSCSIRFTGSTTINVEVTVQAPGFISMVTPNTTTTYQLTNSQQQLIPLRFIMQNADHSEWHAVNLSIRIRETGQELLRQFWIRQKTTVKWKAGLTQPEIFVPETDEQVEIFYWIENTGNVPDEYAVSLETDLQIEKESHVKRFLMGAGERKLSSVTVSLNNLKRSQGRSASVQFRIKGKDGNEKIFVQQVSVIGSRYTQDFFAWKQLPLSVEFSMQHTPASNPIYAAAVRGQVDISKDARMLIDSRLYNFTNRQNRTEHAYLQYQSPSLNVLAGSIIDFHHFLINGYGLEVNKKTKKGEVEGAAIRSRLGNADQYKLQWNNAFSRKLIFTSDNFSNLDHEKKVYSTLSVNSLKWQVSKNTSVSVTAGGSYEMINTWKDTKDLPGSVAGYQFETEWKKFQLQSKVDEYSRSFAGFNKGYTFHNHELKRRIGKGYAGGYYVANKKIYTDNQDSLFSNLFNVNNVEYGFKAGYSKPKFSFFFSTGKSFQQQDSANSIVVESWKNASNFLWRISPDLVLSFCANLSLVAIKDQPQVKPFAAMNNYGNVQFKKFGLYFQYNTGPFYYFETKQYIQSQEIFRRVQLAPFFEQQFSKLNTFLRLQLLYNQELPGRSNNFLVSHQLVFSPPSVKADISINSSYNIENPDASYYMISVRKALRLPVAKNPVSNNFSALLFRDINSNSVFDAGVDEVIPHAPMIINQQIVRANPAGEIIFKNIGAGSLHLDLSHVNEPGWIPSNGFIQTVLPDKKLKKIYIPFKQSKMVTGSLKLIADQLSSVRIQLDNIRVTATDESGNQLATITDAEGKFRFNLPAGNYIISISRSAFDEKFIPVETSKIANLLLNDAVDLQFEIRQQQRQINIRKVQD